MLIDSHAHLDYDSIKLNFPLIIKNAQENKISSILGINTKIKEFNNLYSLIENYKSIWCSVGEHPCNIKKNNIPSKDQILFYSKKPKVIGIGETGLDFYYSKENIDYQYLSLKNHIDASLESDLPLIIHLRNSEIELMEFLIKENKKNNLKVVMHCFTGNKQLLTKCLDNNFYISLSGIITFKNSIDLQNLTKSIPLNKLLIETDAPFLSPVPFRGKNNEPSNVYYIALYISTLLNINLSILSEKISDNFYNLFSKAIKYTSIVNEN